MPGPRRHRRLARQLAAQVLPNQTTPSPPGLAPPPRTSPAPTRRPNPTSPNACACRPPCPAVDRPSLPPSTGHRRPPRRTSRA
jgi:hypothetical protein